MSVREDLKKPLSVAVALILGGMLAWAGFISASILASTSHVKIAEERAELQRLQAASRTLDLAIEFGFDPLIVQITEQLSRDVFRNRKCPECATWRWVDSDRKLTYILLSLIQIESGGNARAYNPSGASGLTQLLYSTAAAYDKDLRKDELFEIPKNLQISVAHFVDLLTKYHGNEHLAILAWNRGSGAVSRSLRLGENPENGYAYAVFNASLRRNVIR